MRVPEVLGSEVRGEEVFIHSRILVVSLRPAMALPAVFRLCARPKSLGLRLGATFSMTTSGIGSLLVSRNRAVVEAKEDVEAVRAKLGRGGTWSF